MIGSRDNTIVNIMCALELPRIANIWEKQKRKSLLQAHPQGQLPHYHRQAIRFRSGDLRTIATTAPQAEALRRTTQRLSGLS